MAVESEKAAVFKLVSGIIPAWTYVTCVHCETGPSLWLDPWLGSVPFLAAFWRRRVYFLTLTDTSVLVISARGLITHRPVEVVASFPRSATPLSEVARGYLYSSMYLRFPGKRKPTRLNIRREWHEDLDTLLAALPNTAVRDEPDGEPGGEPGGEAA